MTPRQARALSEHLASRSLTATCDPYQSTLDPPGTLRVAAVPRSTSQQGRWSCEFTIEPDGSVGAA